MGTIKQVAGWVLQVLTGAMFVLVGLTKFHGPGWERNFARWGYPDCFYMVIGVVEAIGGVALLVPALTTYAALLLMTVMGGAVITHLVHGEPQRLPVPLVYALLVALIGWLRRKSAFRLRKPSPGPVI